MTYYSVESMEKVIHTMKKDFDGLLSETVQQVKAHDDVQSRVCMLTTKLIQIRERYLRFESEITKATGINPEESLKMLKAAENFEPI